MMHSYACTFCEQSIGDYDVASLLERRRHKAPPVIQVACPHCGHVNQLRHQPETELKK